MKKYQVTKIQCQKMIDKLGNVCDSCGRKIVPIETVDNSNNPTYWAGCTHGGESGNFTMEELIKKYEEYRNFRDFMRWLRDGYI